MCAKGQRTRFGGFVNGCGLNRLPMACAPTLTPTLTIGSCLRHCPSMDIHQFPSHTSPRIVISTCGRFATSSLALSKAIRASRARSCKRVCGWFWAHVFSCVLDCAEAKKDSAVLRHLRRRNFLAYAGRVRMSPSLLQP